VQNVSAMLRAIVIALLATAGTASAATLDESAPPGNNYDKAEFRFWYPDSAGPLRALVILVPGSNGDGRPQVDEEFWRAFATRLNLGLVGCRFTDKQHEQMFIEHYVNVSKGTGQALLDALASFARRSGHAEVADAPLLLWGMSAGGEFNYEFAAWKPERVVAFVVNKGNVYYTGLTSDAARRVPGLLFTGETDLGYRIQAVNGLFGINRRAGALWALTQEPGVGHAVARSRDLAAMLFDDMIAARLPGPSGVEGPGLKPLDEKRGFFGDLKTAAIQPVGDSKPPNTPTVWLPNERLARAWQAVVTGKPFDP
jgi:dienelactone hydrolase